MTESLTKRNLLIQAGIEAIPYIGGSLSTLYFGAKQERRFERLEAFYKEVNEEIQNLKGNTFNIDGQNKEELGNLIQEVNDKVEQESRNVKIKYLKNFFISTLQNTLTSDFDHRKHFLDTLSSMSLIECEVMTFLYNHHQSIQIKSLNKPGVSQYVTYSAINKLRSYGYIESRRGNFQMNGQQDEHLDDLVFVSDFGKQFCQYIRIS